MLSVSVVTRVGRNTVAFTRRDPPRRCEAARSGGRRLYESIAGRNRSSALGRRWRLPGRQAHAAFAEHSDVGAKSPAAPGCRHNAGSGGAGLSAIASANAAGALAMRRATTCAGAPVFGRGGDRSSIAASTVGSEQPAPAGNDVLPVRQSPSVQRRLCPFAAAARSSLDPAPPRRRPVWFDREATTSV